MDTEQSQDRKEFQELGSLPYVRATYTTHTSTVIKSGNVKNRGVETIDIVDGDANEPSVHVHRQAERIESIDFICPCGKSAHLTLDYEAE